MPDFTQPSEIAREVLVQLAQRRLQPTPDNYLALYNEIAAKPVPEIFPEKAIKSIASGLQRKTPEQMRVGRQLDQALVGKNWELLNAALADAFARLSAEPPQWTPLIRDLLSQLDTRSLGMTPSQKREAVDRVLSAAGTAELLYQRLGGLLRSWTQQTADAGDPVVGATSEVLVPASAQAVAAGGAAAASVAPSGGAGGAEWRELIALLLDNALPPLLSDTPELAAEATTLSKEVRAFRSEQDAARVSAQLKKFIYRLHFVAEDQVELRTALLNLLRLLVENIDELVIDDQWLHGQVTIVSKLLNEPLDLRRVDDVERRIKDLIYKQGALKKSLNDAKDRLKAMLATFVDRLADMSTVTGDYHDKIERCAQRITEANDISELTNVLDEVMLETRVVQLNAQRSRDELVDMRQRVSDAEKEVARLQDELAQASDMVRMDALTGALNRKGMDEALEREVARSHRQGTELCIALLDIDNFKQLNDSLGHDVGDEALKHLAAVVRDTIRPQDTLARYGGEEFVILLPDTRLDNGVGAMVRVQRELTRRFFMHDNNKLLITFSCGVAEVIHSEPPGDALKRADQAMYLAKRSGKNRVVAA